MATASRGNAVLTVSHSRVFSLVSLTPASSTFVSSSPSMLRHRAILFNTFIIGNEITLDGELQLNLQKSLRQHGTKVLREGMKCY